MASPATVAFSTLPFTSTFLLVAVVVHQKVYPLLSASKDSKHSRSAASSSSSFSSSSSSLPPHQEATTRGSVDERQTSRCISSLAFSATIALSAVLTELLLCEISNSFNPPSRKIALHVTVTSLIVLLIVVLPLLEIHSVIVAVGWKFAGTSKRKARVAWALEVVAFAVFLAGFWFTGFFLPVSANTGPSAVTNPVIACLDRLGITGTAMMAVLSAVGAVSAIWQSFAAESRLVTEGDINRKQAGLDAALDMLVGKKARQRQVQANMTDAPSRGFFQKTMGSLRGNADMQELKSLDVEISGLNTMAASLENSLAILQSRRSSQLRGSTAIGRVTNGFSYVFGCYCVYRISSAIINAVRRRLHPSNKSFASTDPVTNVIAIFARHVYPSLNQAAWARQISFLLSGVILLASFNAALQTFHLFARFLPGVLRAARSNVALFVGQVAGLYVISSALMLRNLMPGNVGGVINDALGAGVLQPAWTEQWFEGWFLAVALVTALGIWLSHKIRGDGVWDDETWDYDLEGGKRL